MLAPTVAHEHYFICPHCGARSKGTDRTVGFRKDVRGCQNCGFAYLFELLDDYYPAPNAAFFALDREGRVVDCGRGAFELTGLRTEAAIGQPLSDVLSLSFDDGTDHVATALEWEVRVAGKGAQLQAGPQRAKASADIFPAYDDAEGGVLVVLTPHPAH
jgi:PAS domain-containing protein